MTQALKELADKVEAGDCRFKEFFDIAGPAFDGLPPLLQSKHNRPRAWSALNGDLNAAKALHETVLLEWDAEISIFLTDGSNLATLRAETETQHVFITRQAVSGDPARAWLLAILRALIEDQQP